MLYVCNAHTNRHYIYSTDLTSIVHALSPTNNTVNALCIKHKGAL